MDLSDEHWWQVFVQGGRAQWQDLGCFDGAGYARLRESTDFGARAFREAK
jgi:hypothetical protein